MKQLFIFISLLLSILNAETLPNTGLQQNNLGYYGEGVTFGGYEIIGEWSIEQSYLNPIFNFDKNGTAGRKKWGDVIYGVSEDGKELIIAYLGADTYKLISTGNNACFNASYVFTNGETGMSDDGYSIICKLKTNQKTYGPSSNKITITVSSE